MGTVTITVDAGTAGSATRTFTTTNANLGRLAAWMKQRATDLDPAASLTTPQALEKWTEWVMETAQETVRANERQRSTVTDFEVTGP